MNLLEGIQLHELVLMILGFILGLVLIFVFLFLALQGRTNLKLLYGFIAPLVMIGYPSIQSVSFSKDVVKIDKLVQKVNENPSDTVAQQALIQEIQTLPKSRCVTSTEALTTIAGAQAALGLYDSAKVTIKKAVERDPSYEKAKESEKDIQHKWQIQKTFEHKVDGLKSDIKQLERQPTNAKVRDSIAIRLNELKDMDAPVRVQQTQAVWVAKAAAIVGEKQAAEQITNAVLKANPELEEARKLKNDIKNRVIEKRFGKTPPKKATPQPAPVVATERTAAPQVASPVVIKQDTPIDVSRMLYRLIPKAAEQLKNKMWDKEN